MSLPDQPPRISKWFFLLSDALLVAVAAFIASHSATPLSQTAIFAIVGCVGTGAVVTGFALIADYTRKQDEALDDRQRALESLARTVAASAEQISIAVGSLHDIAELSQKNLRHAEQLPHKLQEKIAEFQAQLANAGDADREELEKELVALRTSESERLESISDKIAKSAAEWAKLEAAAQKHLAAATAAVAHLPSQAATAIDDKFAALLSLLDARLAAFEATAKALPAPAAPPPVAAPAAAPAVASEPHAPEPHGAESAAHPPKRPRKPRREEPAAEEPAGESAPVAAEVGDAPPQPETAPAVAPVPAPLAAKFDEPPPVPLANIAEIAPVAPHTAEPFAVQAVEPAPPAPPAAPPPTDPAAVEAPKPARKRLPKKPEPEPSPAETALHLDIQETPAAQSAEVAERVLTSDGATRLIVTAYIGIGNRLFIRGDGPGLAWDKGVPLQFVSIGKWRWETHDTSAPVKFKLYKNDETECLALGARTLDPGHQQEVTAAF